MDMLRCDDPISLPLTQAVLNLPGLTSFWKDELIQSMKTVSFSQKIEMAFFGFAHFIRERTDYNPEQTQFIEFIIEPEIPQQQSDLVLGVMASCNALAIEQKPPFPYVVELTGGPVGVMVCLVPLADNITAEGYKGAHILFATRTGEAAVSLWELTVTATEQYPENPYGVSLGQKFSVDKFEPDTAVSLLSCDGYAYYYAALALVLRTIMVRQDKEGARNGVSLTTGPVVDELSGIGDYTNGVLVIRDETSLIETDAEIP